MPSLNACWFLPTGCCSLIGIFAKNHCHATQMQTKPREIWQSNQSNALAWCSPFPTCSQPYSLPSTNTIALERSQHCLAPCLWGSPTAMQSRDAAILCHGYHSESPLAHQNRNDSTMAIVLLPASGCVWRSGRRRAEGERVPFWPAS